MNIFSNNNIKLVNFIPAIDFNQELSSCIINAESNILEIRFRPIISAGPHIFSDSKRLQDLRTVINLKKKR